MQRSSQHPNFLICSISLQLFLEPVTVSPSGHTYEKEMVDMLISEAKAHGKEALCPKSRIPIKDYTTAWSMISAVDDYLAEHPEAKRDQYQRLNLLNTTSQTPSSETAQQVRDDEATARAILRAEQEEEARQQREARFLEEREERRIRNLEEQRRREEERQRQASLAETVARAERDAHRDKVILYGEEEKERASLINDIKNLIYALKFEAGPMPQGRIQNFSLLFFAMIEQAFLEPLPWQKISVKDGPKSTAMYDVLKAAIRALTELNPDVLKETIEQNAGQYDRVKTLFAGEKSLHNDGYASFAKAMGTVKNQPGYLVDQVLLRVNHMMQTLCDAHPNEVKHNSQNVLAR